MILAFERKVDVPLDIVTDKRHYQYILKFNASKYAPFTKNKSNILFGTYFATTKGQKEQFEYICLLVKLH